MVNNLKMTKIINIFAITLIVCLFVGSALTEDAPWRSDCKAVAKMDCRKENRHQLFDDGSICGPNGRKFDSFCEFQKADCKKHLKLSKWRSCSCDEHGRCLISMSGKIEKPKHRYHTRKLGHKSSGGSRRTGNSCEKACTRVYEPVCGSDDKTYDNRCVFETAQCVDPSLTLKQESAC